MTDDPKKVQEGEEQPEQAEPQEQATPGEAFKQGVDLIWQAARGAVGGLRHEIRKADIVGGLRSAAQEMKRAADSAIHGQPRDPEPQDVHADEAEKAKGARIETDGEKPAEGKSSDSK
jgi:hypothetical protein